MTPGWIKSSQGTYSIMTSAGKFIDIYKDSKWNLKMSPKEFTARVNDIKTTLYKEINEKGIIALKNAKYKG